MVERRCDLYIHVSNKTCQWDACAPDIILREAGGTFTDLGGAPIAYNCPEVRNWNGIIASNGRAHDQIVAATQAMLAAR
jgi:3'(2'), 5'-bisphosphate nucleotidase